MRKFQDFYAKVRTDEGAKKEISSILAGKALEAASDEQLKKIGEVAKRLGFDISLDEVRNYLKEGDKKLSEEDLDAVAGGGSSGKDTIEHSGGCVKTLGTIYIDVSH